MLKVLYYLAVLAVVHVGSRKISQSINGRIIGGQDADIRDYPWQISLHDPSDEQVCGGSLIDSTWVLTAAHCLTENDSTNLTIRAGSTNRSSGGEIVAVSKTFIHPLWGTNVVDADLALIQLAAPVTNPIAGIVTLASEGAIAEAGANLTVTGWGIMSELGTEASEVLQYVDLPVVSQEDCKKAYTVYLTDNMLCAGVGGKSACTGDSGGPAVIDGVQYGIVSWSSGCAEPGYPSVFASVPSMRSWITEQTGI